MYLGVDILLFVVGAYKIPTAPPTNQDGKKPFVNNVKAMNSILCNLTKLEFFSLMYFASDKDIWEKL